MEITRPEAQSGILAPAYAYAPFQTAAVLGAGTMGAQIAAHLANAGLEVHLLDVPADNGGDRDAAARQGLERARKLKPNPFFGSDVSDRITIGNFDDDLGRLREVEWIIEAVVERLDVKRSLMARVETESGPDAVISTNTSGLGIRTIAEDRSEDFKRRFLGTHFFNPPRYLKLLELVPSVETDPDVLARVAHFGRVHLGKGIVVAKDTPYFIGNRVGVYGMLRAIREFTDGPFTMEEVDALTGPLVGRPRSATFRTADVVGLDVLMDVAENLYEAVPLDDRREAFRVPPLLRRLVQEGRLGQKTGEGFYKKEGRDIKSVDPETLEYRTPPAMDLPELRDVKADGSLEERLRALHEAPGKSGDFFRRTTLDLLSYCARRIPEIADQPADIDRAIRWGFGWELGPFQIWDALGFEKVLRDMLERGMDVPDWIVQMETGGCTRFYREDSGSREAYLPADATYHEDLLPPDQITLAVIERDPRNEIHASDDSALLDLGDGVALFEFRSKANTLGAQVMRELGEALERVERDRDWKGLVVANEGKNFSVGANLVELAAALRESDFARIERYLTDFQSTIQAVRYARKPVVVAVHQRVLGGGCELVMACPHPVAAAESYVGLVELGVGLIPAGTGSTRLAASASRRSPNRHPSEIQPWVRKYFEAVAMSKVAGSAAEAQELGFVSDHARIVMNDDRRIHVAKEEALRLAKQGYLPPPKSRKVTVLGRPTAAALRVMVRQYLEGGFISEYDAHLADRFAYVLTGGDLSAPQDVHEAYLIELERDVFLDLVRREKTQDRIEHMLKTKKPLRN